MEVITCVNNRAKGAAVRVHAVSQSCGCCRAIDLQSRDYGNADCARLDASPQGVKLPLKELLEVFAAADASPFEKNFAMVAPPPLSAERAELHIVLICVPKRCSKSSLQLSTGCHKLDECCGPGLSFDGLA